MKKMRALRMKYRMIMTMMMMIMQTVVMRISVQLPQDRDLSPTLLSVRLRERKKGTSASRFLS